MNAGAVGSFKGITFLIEPETIFMPWQLKATTRFTIGRVLWLLEEIHVLKVVGSIPVTIHWMDVLNINLL